MSKQSIFSRIQGAVRGGTEGHRRNQVDIISTNAEVYAKTQLTDTGDGFTMLTADESSRENLSGTGEYEESEYLYIKLPAGKKYDLKIEHFDDMILDNSFQSSWAGLDSTLIDEEFLYLEEEEADRIYAQLKARQFRRRNIEETEMRFQARMKAFEEMAKNADQKTDEQSANDGMLASQETIKTYIKNFTDNDKLDFTQGLMNFANKIEKRFLVDGLVMSLHILTSEQSKIKIALLDQFIPLVQLVQEKCTQVEQDKAANEIFRMLDELLYDKNEQVKDKAIDILLDIRTVVQNDDKEHIMKLTLKLAHDQDYMNKVSALKILNKFAQDMGQTLCECFIVPEIKSLGMDEYVQVRIAVARNLINISKIVSFDFFQHHIFPLYNNLTLDSEEKVRKTCADQVAEIAKVARIESQAEELSKVYYRFLKDPTSKLVRGTAFQNIGPFIAAFKNGKDIDTKIIDFYVTTTEGSGNKDVCYHASFNFPAFVFVFGADEWPRFQSLYHKLTKMNEPRIKKTLSASIHELAKILGPKYTEQDLLPCMERFLKDKVVEIKLAALKNLHIFLNEISLEKREIFIKYIVQAFEEANKQEWRLKLALAQNLGNYAKIYDSEIVYTQFLPMFFKFCSDNVTKVGQEACSAIADIIEKFNDLPEKQKGIVKVIQHRYFQSKTFKKRQLYISMCKGQMMMNKDIFERYFKLDFLSLVNDRVPNVRICVAKAIRYHFLKEISGTFVYDQEFNEAVHVLKQDQSDEVKFLVNDIETYPADKKYDLTVDDFINKLNELKGNSSPEDDDSMNSEDEQRIENEVRRHNSEDEIDHGPVLKSLRAAMAKEREQEELAKKLKKQNKQKEEDIKSVNDLLDEADGSASDSSKDKINISDDVQKSSEEDGKSDGQ